MARFLKTTDEWEDARVQLERSIESAADTLRILFESEMLLVAFDYVDNAEDAMAVVNGALLKLAAHRSKIAAMTFAHATNYVRLACTNRAIDFVRQYADSSAARFGDLGLTEDWEPEDSTSDVPFREIETRDEQERAMADLIRPLLEPAMAAFVDDLGSARRRLFREVLQHPRGLDRNESGRSYFARVGSSAGISGGRAEVYWSEIKSTFVRHLRATVPNVALERAEVEEVLFCLAGHTSLRERLSDSRP